MPALFSARPHPLSPLKALVPLGRASLLGLALLTAQQASAQTAGTTVAAVCQAVVASPDAIMLELMANEAQDLEARLAAGDAELACVLQHLISLKGNPLSIDGDFGPQSRRALASVKAVHCNDTDPDERLDRAALSCLIDDSKPLPLAFVGAALPPAVTSPSSGVPESGVSSDSTQAATADAQGGTALSDPLATPLPGPKPSLTTSSAAPTGNTHLRRSSQVTGQPCRDPASSSDNDIRVNLAVFAASPLCYSVVTVEEAGRRWIVQVIENYENVNSWAWLAPHDNEDAAQSGGIWAVAKYGGFLITFETGNQRIFQGQDANRIFAATAQDAATCAQLKAPHPKLTALIDGYFRTAPRPYLSLHSNDNGYSGNGGRGTISVLRRSSVLQGHPAKTNAGKLADDEDNLIMTAGTLGLDNDPTALHFTSAMTHQGIHVIYEAVSPAKNDCSFSNFVKLNRQADYYTVEVEHGKTRRMQELIAILLAYLGQR